MNLFGGVIPVTGITFLVFCLFAIMAVGYSIGRIEIKGISLGTAGVFIAALLFGALFYDDLAVQLPEYTGSALKIVENIGLILFVTSVGFIAGPKFFGNMKKNFKSYVLLGLVIILAGGISAVACIYFGRAMGETDNAKFASMQDFCRGLSHQPLHFQRQKQQLRHNIQAIWRQNMKQLFRLVMVFLIYSAL